MLQGFSKQHMHVKCLPTVWDPTHTLDTSTYTLVTSTFKVDGLRYFVTIKTQWSQHNVLAY